MKPVPLSVRENFGLLIACMCLRRDARHVVQLWKPMPSVLAVVVPDGMSGSVTSVLSALLEKTKVGWKKTTIVSRYSTATDRRDFEGDCHTYKTVVVVTENVDFLPENINAAADEVVFMGRPSDHYWHVAARRLYAAPLRPDDVEMLKLVSFRFVVEAFRAGRHLGRALALTRSAYEATTNRRAVASKTTKSAGPTLDDLHGLGAAGEWGRDLARDLEDWRAGLIPWADVDKGILLSGAPGTGKTTFASALARTCGVHFVAGSISRWQSHGHLGDLLKQMRMAFEEARKHAPSILFLDELDSVGDRATFRGEHKSYSVQVVNGLLELIDGSEAREGVVIVGATNNPSDIDPAVTRPGRLDRHIVIPLPDTAAREGILRYHLRDDMPGVDLAEPASLTEGWSGASLEQLVRTARRSARRARRRMVVGDLVAALPERVRLSDDDVYRMSVHESGHAVIGHALGFTLHDVRVARSTVTDAVTPGGVTQFADDQPYLSTLSLVHRMIKRILAGYASEVVLLDEPSDGAGGRPGTDLYAATVHAAALEASLGMGTCLAMISDANASDLMMMVKTDYDLRARVDRRLRTLMDETADLVRSHRAEIERVAKALAAAGSLDRAAFLSALEGQPQLCLVEL
jgi:cell division protease FtsH